MRTLPLRLSVEERRVLWQLRTRGPTGRTELAFVLQSSNAAVTKLSRNLLDLGLISEDPATTVTGRGRPIIPLRIARAGGYAVGATLHKGVIEIAVVDYAGDIISLTSERVGVLDPRQFATLLDHRMQELVSAHRLIGARLFGVGVGVPGPSLSRDGDRWDIVDKLPGWRDVPLRQIMENTLGLPVWIENDATAAALAEYYMGGLLRRCSTAVIVLLGYGIGAGIINEGRLLKGECGNAGEIGILYPIKRPRPSTLDLLAVLREDGCEIDSVADFDAQTVGRDAVIEQWVDRAAQQLQQAIISAMAWLDPGAIILSSPLPVSLVGRLADRLNCPGILWWTENAPFEIGVSRLGGAATTLGAALLPIHASMTQE